VRQRGRDRRAPQACEQPLHAQRDRRLAGERAAERPSALAQRLELIEDQIGVGDAAGNTCCHAAGEGNRVEETVQDHGADPGWEHVGVGLAEKRAVGDTRFKRADQAIVEYGREWEVYSGAPFARTCAEGAR